MSESPRVRAAIALIAMAAAIPLLVRPVSAHVDPPGCEVLGLSITMQPYRADKRTPIDLGDSVTECETICIRGILGKTVSGRACAFENGVLEIRTPDGVVQNVTPARGVPCLGGTTDDATLPRPMGDCGAGITAFASDFACYTVRREQVVNGTITVDMLYRNGLAHAAANNAPGIAGGGARLSLQVASCAGAVAECAVDVCDRNLRDTDGQSERLGLCVTQNVLDGTPCADTDGDQATFAACSAGQCDQHFLASPQTSGLPGPAGATGPTGPAGPEGGRGGSGPQGPMGPRGETGLNGSKGETGPAAAKGETGPNGPKGETGPNGSKGETGSKGDMGPHGPKGETGPNGPKGETGNGPKGETGPNGPKGETGPNGPKGETGPNGPKGETGPNGLKGDTGPNGPGGPKGDTGNQGSAGPKGATGSGGDTGPAGPRGPGAVVKTMQTAPCNSGVGWCPDGTRSSFLITEPSAKAASSIISFNVIGSPGRATGNNAKKCEVVSIDDATGRFQIMCECNGQAKQCPQSGDVLRYGVINP